MMDFAKEVGLAILVGIPLAFVLAGVGRMLFWIGDSITLARKPSPMPPGWRIIDNGYYFGYARSEGLKDINYSFKTKREARIRAWDDYENRGWRELV